MMKIFITILFSLLFYTISFSQKGDFTLGLDYSQNNENYIYGYDIMFYPYGYYNTANMNFQPRIGYFFSDNIEIGLGYKSGNNDIERTYISYNPSGTGENYSYSNRSNYSYNFYSPYFKYYNNNMFISARLSIKESNNGDNNDYPIWNLDSNGVYMVNSFDNYEYKYNSHTTTTEISVGYLLRYNDKIFFEPSISVRKEIGEVESINIVTTNSESPVITEVISPITDANHFRLNLSLSIRLGR
jgi:hypothetical protein